MTTPQSSIHLALPRAPLVALVALATAASLWALFQWGELLVVRAGGEVFCGADGDSAVNCAAVWDSAFAKAVHTTTKIPVAGWGLMWGLIAFVLSLAALADPDRAAARGLSTSLRLVALAGVASVGGLVVASIVAKHLCLGCLGTYVVVTAWAAIAWSATKTSKFAEPQRGLVTATGALVGAFLVLLYPGTQTPKGKDMGKDALANLDKPSGDGTKPDAPKPTGPGPFDGPLLGVPERDQALQGLIEQLQGQPGALQAMADVLGEFENAKQGTSPTARVAFGDPSAPARFADWTDPLCPHCAELHAVFDELLKVAPGAFALEPHHYPLDGLCNPSVQRKLETGEVRCTAVRAQLCLEEDPDKLHVAQKLIFENQQGLTVDRLWSVLKSIGIDKAKLETCMNSPATQTKLEADIAGGDQHDLKGTPLVLLNGKEIQPWGPLLYAMALTNGKTKHAAFAVLPTPKKRDPHAGHNH